MPAETQSTAAVPVASTAWQADTGTLSVLLLPAPPGSYAVHVALTSGLVLASGSIELVLELANVSPQLGSMGGSTLLTIDGYGFLAEDSGQLTRQQRASPVVLIHVLLSTSNPNAVVLCDVIEVNTTSLSCRTRPYCSADASAEDPTASDCSTASSAPGEVEVVLCPSRFLSKVWLRDRPLTLVACTPAVLCLDRAACWQLAGSFVSEAAYCAWPALPQDALKLYCWSQPSTPRTICSEAACTYSFDAAATPRLLSALPAVAFAGQALELTTQHADGHSLVVIAPADGSSEPAACEVAYVASDGSSLHCTLPDLPAGRYDVSLQRRTALGGPELGLGSWPLVYPPTIQQLEPATGSLAGGTLLSLTAGGAGFNNTHPDANNVLIGGVLPCQTLPQGLSHTTLTCRTPSLAGLVMAEYFLLPMYLSWDKRGFPSSFPGAGQWQWQVQVQAEEGGS